MAFNSYTYIKCSNVGLYGCMYIASLYQEQRAVTIKIKLICLGSQVGFLLYGFIYSLIHLTCCVLISQASESAPADDTTESKPEAEGGQETAAVNGQ